MTDAQSIANRYIDLWNERDAKRRLDMLADQLAASMSRRRFASRSFQRSM